LATFFNFMEIQRTYTAKNLGSGKRKITGICLHDTAGSGKINDVKYLANPGDGRNVSVDFCVTREGEVFQLNPDLANKFCFHAGRATKWKGLRNAANNSALIGIEIVQKADMSLTPLYPAAQVVSVAALCAYLCKKFGLTKLDITTHAKIITDGSRSDPRKFPWDQFWIYFDNERPSETSRVLYTVKAGDTLWGIANKFQTRIETIKALNAINDASNVISVGQVLKIK
jgi:N-acetyl-anhydromuramyl-L-alanine amidase AmpD